MILILVPNTQPDSPEYKQLMSRLDALPGISTRIHKETGTEQSLTEVYLIGNTKALSIEEVSGFPCVDHVVRVSEEYRVLGRHKEKKEKRRMARRIKQKRQKKINIVKMGTNEQKDTKN